jgi:hypothetical protein
MILLKKPVHDFLTLLSALQIKTGGFLLFKSVVPQASAENVESPGPAQQDRTFQEK